MSQPINPQQVRKRMLLFYFAAGANLLMAFWVLSASGGQVGGGTIAGIMCIFLAFAGVNYYMARRFAKYLRQIGARPSAEDSPK